MVEKAIAVLPVGHFYPYIDANGGKIFASAKLLARNL